jgi:hypothetical protein
MKISRRQAFTPALLLLGVLSGSIAKADSIFSIGDYQSVSDGGQTYFPDGQSFTPSIQGVDGTGTPSANSDGTTVYLQSVQINFDTQNYFYTTPTDLYVFASVPIADLGGLDGYYTVNPAGAIGVGIWNGSDFDFTSGGSTLGLEIPFSTLSYAVLTQPEPILEASGAYSGGSDLFDPDPINGVPGIVDDEGTGYDTGFTANFESVPEASDTLALLAGALGLIGLFSRRLRKPVAT